MADIKYNYISNNIKCEWNVQFNQKEKTVRLNTVTRYNYMPPTVGTFYIQRYKKRTCHDRNEGRDNSIIKTGGFQYLFFNNRKIRQKINRK